MRQTFLELPIYKKAEEIYQLVQSMTSFVEDYPFEINYPIDQEIVDDSIKSMKEKSHEIKMLIMYTCHDDRQYHEAMEYAMVIKYYVNEVVCDVNCLENTGLKESEFVDVFHETLEEFRVLFKEWITTFPKFRYYAYDADWGLYELHPDVVVLDYPTGERFDEDNPLHRMRNYHEVWDEDEDEDEDEFEDEFEDEDEDEFEDEDDEV